MNITGFLAKCLYYSFAHSLILPLRKIIKRNEILLLGYHRVSPREEKDGLFNKGVISCPEEQFEKEVKFLKSNFDILTFKDLDNLGANTERYRFAIITFDDGYIDNYTKVYPILKEHGVNAVFFIVPGIINGLVEPWWELLCYYNKENLMSQTITMTPSDFDKMICQIKEESNMDSLKDGYFKDKFMNWEQIIKMHNDGMEIGCHTFSHYILSKCNNAEKVDEIVKAKEIIEEKINSKVITFAYPVGGVGTYDDECVSVLKQMGIKYAVTYNDLVETFPFRNKYMIGRLQSEYYNNSYHFVSRITLPEIIRW